MNVKEENKNSHTRMKRERDIEDMEVKAESSRQKSRRLTHVEQIDLTSD